MPENRRPQGGFFWLTLYTRNRISYRFLDIDAW